MRKSSGMTIILACTILWGSFTGCAPQTITFSAQDVEFVEADDAALDPYFPGRLEYIAQPDKAKSVSYAGEAKSLTVTGSDGSEWTLLIPAGALPAGENREIMIAPIADGTYTDGMCRLTGLQLEPQGLNFIKGVTLTYRNKDRGYPLMFLSDSDGGSLEPLPVQMSDAGFSVTLNHFSTVTTPAPDATPEEALALAEEVLMKAEKCLKEKIKVKVPDIDFEDMDETDFKQFNITERELLCPEAGYLAALAVLPELLSQAGLLDTAYQTRINSAFESMTSRFYAKMDAFIEKYEGQPEQAIIMLRAYSYNKVLAVLPIAVHSHEELTEGEQQRIREQMDENIARYEEVAVRWGNAAWEKGIEELRSHNFRVLMAVYHMANDFSIRHEPYKTKDMLAQAEDVMAFELNFEGEIEDSQPDARATWSIEGSIPLSFHFEMWDEDVHKYFFWEGTGSTKFVGYQSDTGMRLSPGDTPIEAEVHILGRSPNYKLSLRPKALSPDKLEYSDDDGTYTIGSMQMLVASILVEYYQAGRYEMIADFDNDASTQGEVDAHTEYTEIHYSMDMKHTPR